MLIGTCHKTKDQPSKISCIKKTNFNIGNYNLMSSLKWLIEHIPVINQLFITHFYSISCGRQNYVNLIFMEARRNFVSCTKICTDEATRRQCLQSTNLYSLDWGSFCHFRIKVWYWFFPVGAMFYVYIYPLETYLSSERDIVSEVSECWSWQPE